MTQQQEKPTVVCQKRNLGTSSRLQPRSPPSLPRAGSLLLIWECTLHWFSLDCIGLWVSFCRHGSSKGGLMGVNNRSVGGCGICSQSLQDCCVDRGAPLSRMLRRAAWLGDVSLRAPPAPAAPFPERCSSFIAMKFCEPRERSASCEPCPVPGPWTRMSRCLLMRNKYKNEASWM